MNPRIRIQQVETLSEQKYILKKTTFDYLRKDGTWQTQIRETYDRGNGAAILLYNTSQKTIILTSQFRFPTYVNGNETGFMIEVCAGLLDQDNPEDCIRKETQEETGYIVDKVKKVFEAYMSPGSVTERLFFFIGEYSKEHKKNEGGGEASEGEDIDVLELSLDEAFQMIESGEIIDAKTIMLLQYAKIHNLV
jgi:nudix-type nucleoside diphosphatase (YffH/AdpP family)